MKRTLSLVLSVTLVSLLSARAPVPVAKPDTSYYPLKIGTQWQYQIGPSLVTMRVANHEKVGTVTCGVVETSIDNKVVGTEDISSDATGVYRHKFNGMTSNEPLCLLKLPVKKGATWKFDIKIANETVKGAFVCGEDEITVPAGKFKTVTAFTTECDLNGNKAEFKYWFAPGVGIVRQTINLGGREIVSELKEFKAGD